LSRFLPLKENQINGAAFIAETRAFQQAAVCESGSSAYILLRLEAAFSAGQASGDKHLMPLSAEVSK